MKQEDIDGVLLDIEEESEGQATLYYYQLSNGDYATYVKDGNGKMIRVDEEE